LAQVAAQASGVHAGELQRQGQSLGRCVATMSKFSTLDTQHSGQRELERQRLERMMGQLRREVEGKGAVADAAEIAASRSSARQVERRFKPPRRRSDAPPRPTPGCSVEQLRSPVPTPLGPCPTEQFSGHSAVSNVDVPVAAMKPGPPEPCSERPPSLELAWLMRASSRMDADSKEVNDFLAHHELSRYAALLADDAQGLGASLDALRSADDAALAKAGMPASDRIRLVRALKDNVVARATPSAGPAMSVVSAGADGASRPTSSASVASASSQWGCLGRLPPGWTRLEGQRKVTVTRPAPAAFADACTGGDSELEEEEVEAASEVRAAGNLGVGATAGSAQEVLILEPVDAADARVQTPVKALPSTPLAVRSRPGTATRPNTAETASGEGRASVGKVCCYQCYKQVYQQHAVQAEDTQKSTIRSFCHEDCASRFRQALAARVERERELSNLRSVALG